MKTEIGAYLQSARTHPLMCVSIELETHFATKCMPIAISYSSRYFMQETMISEDKKYKKLIFESFNQWPLKVDFSLNQIFPKRRLFFVKIKIPPRIDV